MIVIWGLQEYVSKLVSVSLRHEVLPTILKCVCVGWGGGGGSKDNQEISGLVDKAGIYRPMVLPVIGDRLLATLNN